MGRLEEVTVSVLMLTYNRETMVSRAIESILAQTFSDFEFIIVDNGSTDQSGAIAEEYAALDHRIRVIHRPRGNIGAGRNTALDAARGKYLTFIDDDDWAEPDFLEFLVSLLEENGADVAICGATGRVFDEKKIMTAEEALIELMWRKKYNVGFPTKMIRQQKMELLRFPEAVTYDDIALMYRLLAECEQVAYHGLLKYNICRHPGNNSAWTTNHSLLTPETLQEYLDAYRTRTQWLSEKFPNSAEVFQYFEWSFMISMVEKIQRLDLKGCKDIGAKLMGQLWTFRERFLTCPEILPYEKKFMEQYILSGGNYCVP
ncbi:glycosyltransferase family 2 protein [Flavonifractor sp. An306]|uniref:glycosyltransferase family 2 protein n=1 Tax=Flavonifractor sp. An306 TaxID=1965629 RepID=UPI000B397852|nr:glycosyltransferase family 2 protein [Flavonifractor sp. An306]OUO39654.1 glycosyltransferase [Flavonifractor sp. An306]